MEKFVIVGLGNVGRDYEKTRHNVGFMAVDEIAEHFDFPDFSHDASLHAWAAGQVIGDTLVLLVKPDTLMNRSGTSVAAIAAYYKLEPERFLIIYDDVDLPCGEVRKREKGSAGTHNGMRDIIAKMGTELIPRLRIGIGATHPIKELSAYVLGRMSQDEQVQVMEGFREKLEEWIGVKG